MESSSLSEKLPQKSLSKSSNENPTVFELFNYTYVMLQLSNFKNTDQIKSALRDVKFWKKIQKFHKDRDFYKEFVDESWENVFRCFVKFHLNHYVALNLLHLEINEILVDNISHSQDVEGFLSDIKKANASPNRNSDELFSTEKFYIPNELVIDENEPANIPPTDISPKNGSKPNSEIKEPSKSSFFKDYISAFQLKSPNKKKIKSFDAPDPLSSTPYKKGQSKKASFGNSDSDDSDDPDDPEGNLRHKKTRFHSTSKPVSSSLSKNEFIPKKSRMQSRSSSPTISAPFLDTDDDDSDNDNFTKSSHRKPSKGLYSNKEDWAIIDYVFNHRIPNRHYMTLTGVEYWKMAEKYLRKEKNVNRSWHSIKERFRKRIVQNLHTYNGLNEEKHRSTAIICYEAFLKDKCHSYTHLFNDHLRNHSETKKST